MHETYPDHPIPLGFWVPRGCLLRSVSLSGSGLILFEWEAGEDTGSVEMAVLDPDLCESDRTSNE